MKQKKTGKGKIIGYSLLGILALLALVIGIIAYRTMPVYPAFEKPVESVDRLRENLSESETAKDCVVPDPAIFGAEPDEIVVKLSGRNRNSAPIGYGMSCRNGNLSDYKGWWLSCLPAKNTVLPDGSNYRNHLCSLSNGEVPSGGRYLSFDILVGDYVYGIEFSYDPSGLTQEQQSQQEETLQKYLYAAADQIIDGTEQ